MEGVAEPRISGGVGFVEGVVEDVAVAVEVLAVFGDLNVGVGTEHSSQLWVVESAVHVDEAAVIELFVSGVAAIVVGGTAAEGIGIALAVGLGGGGVGTLAPGIEGLALAGGDGEGFRCLVPCGGEKEVGGAEVVGEDVGEFYAGSCCGDGSGINDGTQIVAMEGFGGDGGGGGIR